MRTIKLSERRPPLSPIHLLSFRLFSTVSDRETDERTIKTFVTSSFVPVRIFITLLSEHHQHLLPASSICDFLFIPVYCHYNLYARSTTFMSSYIAFHLFGFVSISLSLSFVHSAFFFLCFVILFLGSQSSIEK